MTFKELRVMSGLNQYELSEKTGIPRDRISKWDAGKASPKAEDFEIIKNLFSKMGISVYKEGKNFTAKREVSDVQNNKPPALKEASMISVPADTESYSNRFGVVFRPLDDGRFLMGVPLVPQYVKGGPMAGFADPEYFEELPKHWVTVDKIHRGKYLAFDVDGDSMDYDGRDYIADGARLTVREIRKDLWAGSKLHLNHYKDFVIEYSEGICVKRIVEHDLENYTITCRSLNTDKDKYPDFVLNLNEVVNLFNVIKVDNPR